jgi:16S rRNA (guanine527-N7)-methyltransferase
MVEAGSHVDADLAGRLNEVLAAAALDPLPPESGRQFAQYCALLLRWNARTNLTAIRDKEGILSRHFVESIACARALPEGITNLLDFGSGAGFPGIPVALCRPEIAVTLAESQGKKSAFLREAVRVLGLSAEVYSGRAETLAARFDCVTLRAVDRMRDAAIAGSELLAPDGWLALLITEDQFGGLRTALGAALKWCQPIALAGSEQRVLALGWREELGSS